MNKVVYEINGERKKVPLPKALPISFMLQVYLVVLKLGLFGQYKIEAHAYVPCKFPGDSIVNICHSLSRPMLHHIKTLV